MKILNYIRDEQQLVLKTDQGDIYIEVIKDTIFRVVYTKEKDKKNESVIVVAKEAKKKGEMIVQEENKELLISSNRIQCIVNKETGQFTWQDKESGHLYVKEAGKELAEIEVIKYSTGREDAIIERVKTVDGERNFIRNLEPYPDRKAYRGKLSFQWLEDEGIYGLGQAEEGIYNYRGHNQYLYQHNMRIPIPFFVSSQRYGILLDCCSLMTFNDDHNGSYLYLDTIEQMDYYFIAGNNFDELIGAFRYLTGKAVLLPRWAFGYIQSREAYNSGNELLEVARKYRHLGIPLDAVVQDWNTWENGKWGQKTLDKQRYPHLKNTIDQLHKMHVQTMFSIWPSMNPGGENHQEFFEAGFLLNDYSTYNAFTEEGRAMYWRQLEEELFSSGVDSWWSDSTEPFSGPDWGGEIKREPWERFQLVGNEHKHFLDPAYANVFALFHARGIYENQRKITEEKRVLNLTRSGYAGSQQYGTVLWSGDISASWEVLRKQIVEGLNFALSGMPYWTLDIGGFFVVNTAWQNRGCGCNTNPEPLWFWNGDYNQGVDDLGYRELYVRWLEYATFLPLFRSHGTDTPREIWNFGHPGKFFYDAIEKFIRLRYYLLPYIYSLAANVYLQNGTILRSLLFDFLADQTARKIKDEFMFGPAILVCPVTEAMYYAPGSEVLDREKIRECYLPTGAVWYDYWTGKKYTGGIWLTAAAPLDQIPLFIKGGSILPVIDGLQYADQQADDLLQINIYGGADGRFLLYEDEGNGYHYEQDEYSIIPLQWEDEAGRLIIGCRQGGYAGMKAERNLLIRYGQYAEEVNYAGQEIQLHLPR